MSIQIDSAICHLQTDYKQEICEHMSKTNWSLDQDGFADPMGKTLEFLKGLIKPDEYKDLINTPVGEAWEHTISLEDLQDLADQSEGWDTIKDIPYADIMAGMAVIMPKKNHANNTEKSIENREPSILTIVGDTGKEYKLILPWFTRL